MASPTFGDIVAREFGSVGSEFGFREVQRNVRAVRFESLLTYLIFTHTRFDEIEVSFGQLSDEVAGRTGFGIFDLLHSIDPDLGEGSRARIASSPTMVAEAVHEIVAILKSHGQAVMSGDRQTYESFAKRRSEMQQSYQNEATARRLRPEAETAFKKADYAKAARLYRSIGDMLSDVERRKLAFAESKVGTDQAKPR